MNPFSPYAKAYAALIGSICTALLGVFTADTQVGAVLTVISIVATTFVTFQVKNAPENPRSEDGAVSVVQAQLVAVLVLAVLWFFGVHPRVDA